MYAREEGKARRLGVGYCSLVLGLYGHAVCLGEACRSGLRLRLGGGYSELGEGAVLAGPSAGREQSICISRKSVLSLQCNSAAECDGSVGEWLKPAVC